MVLRLRQILDNDFLPCNRGIDEDSAKYSHINRKADHGPTLGSRGCQVRVARRKFDSTLVLIDHDGQLQYRHRRKERHRLFDLVPSIKKSLRDAFSYSRTR